MPPHIYLDISTGHLTDATRRLLDKLDSRDRTDLGWPAMTVASYEYGWFITVPDYGNPEVAEQAKNMPRDLDEALCHGYKSGASAVRFDADGDALHALPHYEEV